MRAPKLAAAMVFAALLPGCIYGPPVRQGASDYHERDLVFDLTLDYDQGDTVPDESQAIRVRNLRGGFRSGATLTLTGAGPLMDARARWVSQAIGRRVESLITTRSPQRGQDATALLEVREREIVADPCLRAPERVGRNLWTFDDDDRQSLLPPGCAAASAMQAQVSSPSDLLRGRPVEPGAATPFVRAIERYYRRNDARASGDARGATEAASTSEGGGANGGDTGGGGAPASSAAPGTPANGPNTTGLRNYLNGVGSADPGTSTATPAR